MRAAQTFVSFIDRIKLRNFRLWTSKQTLRLKSVHDGWKVKHSTDIASVGRLHMNLSATHHMYIFITWVRTALISWQSVLIVWRNAFKVELSLIPILFSFLHTGKGDSLVVRKILEKCNKTGIWASKQQELLTPKLCAQYLLETVYVLCASTLEVRTQAWNSSQISSKLFPQQAHFPER